MNAFIVDKSLKCYTIISKKKKKKLHSKVNVNVFELNAFWMKFINLLAAISSKMKTEKISDNPI